MPVLACPRSTGLWSTPSGAQLARGPPAASDAFASRRPGAEAMMRMLHALWKDEEGPTAVEYAIMASLIAVAIAATAGALGVALEGLFTQLTDAPW
jgi:pilus assembly protein Flp/PilA